MTEGSTGRKLLWFVGLWAGGVLAVTLLGFAIKLAIGT
ncbi:hypothetical protein DUF2474 [Shinella sp. DD12]|nr:hypothetical protein DUF2474 [Shinella sp. DD12]